MKQALLGVDIGATGIKVGAFTTTGHMLACAGRRNGPVQQPDGDASWMMWDADDIWRKVTEACKEVVAKLGSGFEVKSVACTGFGADGIPLDRNGTPLYPFISWHCSRTALQSRQLADEIGNDAIFQITGYHNYAINTVNRFRWLSQNRADVLEKAHAWLQLQDYIAYRFSRSFSTECTIASTTMMLDMGARTWSEKMLQAGCVPKSLLPTIHEAGTEIGVVTREAAEQTGLPVGIPVVTGGHDCEIAVLGAGVNRKDVLIDITGTWEILIALVDQFAPKPEHYAHGLDFECHAVPGKWICQSLLIAGGVVEWIRNNFYRDCSEETVYEAMFGEAGIARAHTSLVLPSFMPGMGPGAQSHALGTILGITTTTTRGQIVRGTLEGLCHQLRQQTEALESVIGQSAVALRVVGGGQKNPLWLQMKADATNLPVEITSHPEVTLLGVALLAGVGAGIYRDIEDALAQVNTQTTTFEPETEGHARFEERYQSVYRNIVPSLAGVYCHMDSM